MLYILKDGLPRIASPLTPAQLAAAHPVWHAAGAESADSADAWQEGRLGSHAVYLHSGRNSPSPFSQSSFPPSASLSGARPDCSTDAFVDTGKGTHAASSPSFLSERWEMPIVICGECTSALDVARPLATENALPEWGSLLALRQTTGRGQLRRPWNSPVGNVYAVLRLPAQGPHLDDFAPLTLGYLFAHAFAELGLPLALKWPNDLLRMPDAARLTKEEDAAGVKVGGILVEEYGSLLCAGIGLNVVSCPPPEALREGAATPAGCLYPETAVPCVIPDVIGLWQKLVQRVHFWYVSSVVHYNREELTNRVQKYLAWVGRDVLVHGGDADDRPGRLLGVNESGALRLLLSGHECAVVPNSISLSSYKRPSF